MLSSSSLNLSGLIYVVIHPRNTVHKTRHVGNLNNSSTRQMQEFTGSEESVNKWQGIQHWDLRPKSNWTCGKRQFFTVVIVHQVLESASS